MMIKKITEKIKTFWQKFKKWVWIVFGFGMVCLAAPLFIPHNLPTSTPIFDPILYANVHQWQRPTTDLEWAEDVKKENLNLKHDYQLDQMEQNLTEKLPKLQKDLDRFILFPDYVKYELTERFRNEGYRGRELTDLVDKEFQERLFQYTLDVEKIQQSLERIEKEKELRATKKVERAKEIIGTTYYLDCVNGSSTLATSTGTTTDTAWQHLDQFTEVVRAAGDKVIVRRDGAATTCDDGTDLNFTSDGTVVAPIVIEADFDNLWGDFASSTQTYTVTFGSLTMTASAEITGIAAGDWIYVSGDSNRDFSYEVASIGGAGTTTLTLYLPYKGNQSGAGLTLNIMPDNPIWNTAAGDFQWNFDTDIYWKIQGINIRGTDANGQVEIDSSEGHQFIDCIFIGNGITVPAIYPTDDYFFIILNKSRIYNDLYGIQAGSDVFGALEIYNSLFDGNNLAASYGIMGFTAGVLTKEIIVDSTFKNWVTYALGSNGIGITSKFRNLSLSNNTVDLANSSFKPTSFGFEDYNGTIGDNRFHNIGAGSNMNVILFLSNSTTIRSGGGATSIEVRPTTNFSTAWDFSKVLLFEYPIYADTSSRTYTVYFNLPDANFTVDPTASELWIELEAWGHATNNYRKITKSTGTITSDGNWNTLTITVAPAQTGVAYLRGYYAKTKEAASNIFYVDIAPVIE